MFDGGGLACRAQCFRTSVVRNLPPFLWAPPPNVWATLPASAFLFVFITRFSSAGRPICSSLQAICVANVCYNCFLQQTKWREDSPNPFLPRADMKGLKCSRYESSVFFCFLSISSFFSWSIRFFTWMQLSRPNAGNCYAGSRCFPLLIDVFFWYCNTQTLCKPPIERIVIDPDADIGLRTVEACIAHKQKTQNVYFLSEHPELLLATWYWAWAPYMEGTSNTKGGGIGTTQTRYSECCSNCGGRYHVHVETPLWYGAPNWNMVCFDYFVILFMFFSLTETALNTLGKNRITQDGTVCGLHLGFALLFF